jgi:hypothetical protein
VLPAVPAVVQLQCHVKQQLLWGLQQLPWCSYSAKRSSSCCGACSSICQGAAAELREAAAAVEQHDAAAAAAIQLWCYVKQQVPACCGGMQQHLWYGLQNLLCTDLIPLVRKAC